MRPRVILKLHLYFSIVIECYSLVDKNDSRQTGGTSLGGVIVKHGAQVHRAAVHLQSTENQGTIFEVVFH